MPSSADGSFKNGELNPLIKEKAPLNRGLNPSSCDFTYFLKLDFFIYTQSALSSCGIFTSGYSLIISNPFFLYNLWADLKGGGLSRYISFAPNWIDLSNVASKRI
jgi:hypothetical protein